MLGQSLPEKGIAAVSAQKTERMEKIVLVCISSMCFLDWAIERVLRNGRVGRAE